MNPEIDYVLPLRWEDDAGLDELTGYLRRLARQARVIVVDGSPAPLFDRHAAAWRGLVQHLPPDPDLRFRNGKVNGVTTGMRRARQERVVIADDDVRYRPEDLRELARLLAGADLVRPQNYFDPLPWHARWDTARSLLNRSVGADYPGTLGVRRSAFLAVGGYDGDVLFENLELIRTMRAAGYSELRAPWLYVRRLPPDTRRFLDQRVRQAYDDLAQPYRLLLFLSLLPVLAAAGVIAGPAAAATGLLAGAGLAVGLAELGRRRAGGRAVFPAGTALLAPLWVAERACCSWAAVALRLCRGGVRYRGGRIPVAAHPFRTLAALRRAGGPEAADLVRPVAERLEAGQAAAAQRHRPAARIDSLPVLGDQLE